MYTVNVEVDVPEDLVHKHSLLEWEEILLAAMQIEPEDRPISYAFVAEFIAQMAIEGTNWFLSLEELQVVSVMRKVHYNGTELALRPAQFAECVLKGR